MASLYFCGLHVAEAYRTYSSKMSRNSFLELLKYRSSIGVACKPDLGFLSSSSLSRTYIWCDAKTTAVIHPGPSKEGLHRSQRAGSGWSFPE